jgi:hypothetical protein
MKNNAMIVDQDRHECFTAFHANREVLRITHDGRMICGEGLSKEEATQEAAKLLISAFEKEIQEMVDARVAADTAQRDWLLENAHNPYATSATIDFAMKEASK